jgi:hypothetical protein
MSKKTRTRRHRRHTETTWVECDCGKRGFSSRSAARRAMSKASNKVRLYICPLSGTWHVTANTDTWEGPKP